ncbi:transposase [Actinomyces gerencseriae]|uniref:IS110 family transposase n=1 Tax=Actinomyces gerencseriae TaxID=52769 RepID=UPI0028E7C8CF|nr:transposase [Actinomyces gerencseriae]
MDIEGIDVFIAPASARSEHRATAPTRAGRKALDKALPDDEARPRALYDKPADTTSRPTTGARWWWSISPPPPGALALAVAQDMGITMGYPPELSMRRTADPAPDSAKTDAKDAAVIAGAARTMPPTLRAISTSEEDTAALSMLSLVSTRTRPARSTRARAASGASRQALPTTRNQRRNYPQPLDTPHRPPETHTIPRAILNAPGEPTSTGGLARLVAIPPSSWSRVSDSNR